MLRISSATLPSMLSNLAEKLHATSIYEYDWQRVTIATLAILAPIYSYWVYPESQNPGSGRPRIYKARAASPTRGQHQVFLSWAFPYGYSLNRVSLFYIDYEDPDGLKEESKRDRTHTAAVVAIPVFYGTLFGPGKLLLANDDIETKDLLRVSARVIFLVIYHREASRAILTTESRLLEVLLAKMETTNRRRNNSKTPLIRGDLEIEDEPKKVSRRGRQLVLPVKPPPAVRNSASPARVINDDALASPTPIPLHMSPRWQDRDFSIQTLRLFREMNMLSGKT
ncbi:hypothetical protein TWF128_010055 [Orbilia oligospora]|nr:hypothetical protein TWF128_010055 [Orbilia oligospora]